MSKEVPDFIPKELLEDPKFISQNFYQSRKVYPDKVIVRQKLGRDLTTIFRNGDVHMDNPPEGEPRLKPVRDIVNKLAIVDMHYEDEPGFTYIVNGNARLWVSLSGRAFDFILQDWLSPEEYAYRALSMAEYEICELDDQP